MATTAKGTPYVVSTDLVANYPTVSSDLATHIDDDLAYNVQDINAQTGTTYTFALADATLYKLVTATNAAASTYTVPPQSSVTWVTGSVLRVLNQGAGVVTLAGGSGVTLNGSVLTLNQYQYAELHRTASNTWTVTGISTPPGLTLITSQTLSGSSVSINNCFTSIYDAYKIVCRATHSTNGELRFRMRASGSDETGSVYVYQGIWGQTTTVTVDTQTLTNGFLYGGTSTTNFFSVTDMYGPQNAENTYANSVHRNSVPGVGIMGTIVNTTSVYDGITIYPSTGTFSSGQIRIYGYRD